MRGPETPLDEEVVGSFLIHRDDLSAVTARNYRRSIQAFIDWSEREFERAVTVADLEPGTVGRFLHTRRTVSPESARTAWVALRSLAKGLAEMGIHHDDGESVLRRVRQPKVKEERRRNLSDPEMFRLMERAAEGEMAERDRTIVVMLLGTGLRRGELIGLRMRDVDLTERSLHVRASTSKSVRPRDIALPVEVVKELDRYVRDFRKGDTDEDDPLFTDRRGRPLTGTTVHKLFERLKVRSGIRDLSAHMCRHTWATNFHRSSSGSRFDLQVEGGWTTGRMVERYCKARPFEERRRAPSPFTAWRAALSGKRPTGKRPPQKGDDLGTIAVA